MAETIMTATVVVAAPGEILDKVFNVVLELGTVFRQTVMIVTVAVAMAVAVAVVRVLMMKMPRHVRMLLQSRLALVSRLAIVGLDESETDAQEEKGRLHLEKG
ncbi:hypothetical protein SPI_00360 [Niveomyces insectorum RCEF 264]|uniref:Uncharacterized protein n=1 Tax=Niveomyces insectorum RCEF 264 TaxID=1081102 RepID=A0A168A2K5_9HYPO|nr:hypothetical protein SPI_00360 [Niveomyces insectorum RCEF 264]